MSAFSAPPVPPTPPSPRDPPTPSLPAVASAASERTIVFLVALVQFVNILDFMMVMPLGPDFARDLGIPASQLGVIGGSYTAAAAVAGLVGAVFLDRFDRRRALAVTMLGLVIATAAGGLATSLGTLVAARVVAGCFGGPASSLALSIVADVVPPARRGRALGAVMGAFSAASILGVPAGLELARLGTWRTPFFAVAGFGVFVVFGALAFMPAMRLHLARAATGDPERDVPLREMLSRPAVLLSLTTTGLLMMGGFAVIPNFSAFVQNNMGYPRSQLGYLYLAGGLVSLVVMRVAGIFVDRVGAILVAAVGTVLYVTLLGVVFVPATSWVPAMVIFVGFMASQSIRNVAFNTLSSRVPRPRERARVQSFQSAVQHLAAAAGAMLSAQMLTEAPGGRLVGMDRVAMLSIALAVAAPFVGAFIRLDDVPKAPASVK